MSKAIEKLNQLAECFEKGEILIVVSKEQKKIFDSYANAISEDYTGEESKQEYSPQSSIFSRGRYFSFLDMEYASKNVCFGEKFVKNLDE